MAKQAKTKDELFMIKLYEEASKLPDIEDPLNRYHIGSLAGIQPKAVDAICNLLVQANFIKKRGDEDVVITPHGIKLAESLKNP